MCYSDSLFACDERVPQHHNDRVSSQEHFGDVAILIHGLRLLLAFATLGYLRPHLLHVFQNHVAMSVEGKRQKWKLHCGITLLNNDAFKIFFFFFTFLN